MNGALDKFWELLFTTWNFFKCVQILDADEGAAITRWGILHRSVGPGLHWNWPFAIERIHRYPITTDTLDLGNQSLTTKDGHSVEVCGIAVFAVVDVAALLLKSQGEKEALIDSCMGEIGFAVLQANWDALVTEEFWNAVTIKARRKAKRWGIELEALRFRHLTRTRTFHIFSDK